MHLLTMFMPVPNIDPETDWVAVGHAMALMMLKVASMFI